MIKLNNGNEAVVCDICHKVISTGVSSENIIDVCDQCQQESQVVDNFDKLADQLIFDDENTFYWVQIIKRRKDNPGMHGDYVSFGDYWIYSLEQLFSLKDELIKTSRVHNARVVLWINRRDSKEILFEAARLALDYYKDNQFNAAHSLVQHVTGKHRKKYEDASKTKSIRQIYIVDVDSKSQSYLNNVLHSIYLCVNPGDTNFKIYDVVPTLHGFHILCSGFNLDKFRQELKIRNLDPVDIQKDNPTILYFCPQ